MGNDPAGERERYLREIGLRDGNGPLGKVVASTMAANVEFQNGKPGWRRSVMDSIKVELAGSHMETTAQLLGAVRTELETSKEVVQGLANEVSAVTDVVNPQLLALAKDLRSSRMGVVSEVREALTAMREVRKFFLESDYATEMHRLERFVALCKEIQVLKQSGVFDAVCESAIRLAVREAE